MRRNTSAVASASPKAVCLAPIWTPSRAAIVPATDATTATYRRVYESALFEQRGILPPTPSVRTPGRRGLKLKTNA